MWTQVSHSKSLKLFPHVWNGTQNLYPVYLWGCLWNWVSKEREDPLKLCGNIRILYYQGFLEGVQGRYVAVFTDQHQCFQNQVDTYKLIVPSWYAHWTRTSTDTKVPADLLTPAPSHFLQVRICGFGQLALRSDQLWFSFFFPHTAID